MMQKLAKEPDCWHNTLVYKKLQKQRIPALLLFSENTFMYLYMLIYLKQYTISLAFSLKDFVKDKSLRKHKLIHWI